MTRRNLVLTLAAASASVAQNPPAQNPPSGLKLELVDITVGEFSTSLRLPDNFGFLSGMPVYLSFRISGYDADPELSLVNLEYSVEFLDAVGNRFDKPITGRYSRRVSTLETAPLPFVRVQSTIPEYVHPGDAKFRVRVTDKRSRQTAEAEGAIPIRSDLPKTSGKFEILDLKLYRSEAQENPVTTDAAFAPGDVIWLRFLLAGFEWKEHEFNLRYGINLLGKDGRTVLSVPEAAAERNASEYLRAYVPAVASIRLERTARPGPCTLIIHAVDGVAKQESKISLPFQILALK
ncbi:MAG: hypothetical protein SGI92_23395 [Bryobacteraceae bacterium]|nr:hypothetical protein [Bryobacteraceae bacterium]